MHDVSGLRKKFAQYLLNINTTVSVREVERLSQSDRMKMLGHIIERMAVDMAVHFARKHMKVPTLEHLRTQVEFDPRLNTFRLNGELYILTREQLDDILVGEAGYADRAPPHQKTPPPSLADVIRAKEALDKYHHLHRNGEAPTSPKAPERPDYFKERKDQPNALLPQRPHPGKG